MGLHFYVKFGEDAQYTDITEYIKYDSVKFDIQLMSKKFKSVQDSVSAKTVYDQTINNKFFTASTWMPAYITYDLQEEQMYGYPTDNAYGDEEDVYGFLSPGRIFTGAVFPITKDQYKSYPDEGVSFEIVDNSYLLEVDCCAFTYQNFKVFDPADVSHSIIHQLLYSAGLIEANISSLNTISKTVGYISYEAKDETINKIIDELLYEYHHAYYFNENGQFCLYDWKHDSITLAGTITDAVIKDKDGIKRERNIYEFDGYLVKYKELLSKTNVLIYREDIPDEGDLLIPSQAFPVDGEIKTIKQSYSNKWLSDDAKILLTSNHALTLTADEGIAKPVEMFGNLDAQIVIKNTDTINHRFYQFDIRADVIYTDKENEFTLPTTATLTDDEIDLEHIYNSTDALEFANALYNNTVRYGLHVYEFKSEKPFDVGFCYELEHYNVNILLIGKKYNYYEHIFEYECLSVGAQVVETPDILYRLPSGVGSDSPSRYLALEADFNSIDVTARGVILVPTITFRARTIDIPITNISWSRSDAGSLGLVGENDYLRILDTSTVVGEFVTITITASYGGASYSATYTVKKVYQNSIPMFLGEYNTETPKTYNGLGLINDDFFIVSEEFIENTVTYKAGTLWVYNDGNWDTDENPIHAIDAMNSFVDIKLRDPSAVDEGIFCEVVAKKIMAQEAVITEIGTKEITLKTGGKIQSEVYTPGVAGFQIKADGSADFINSSMVSGLFTGTIDSPPLTTTEESDAEDPVTFDSFTHWRSADVYNALVTHFSTGTWHTVSGTYNTVPIIKAFMTASTAKPIEFDLSGSSSSSGKVYRSATIVYAGTYDITIYGRDVHFPPGTTEEGYAVYVNGVRVLQWYNIVLNAGDVVKIELYGGDWVVDPNYTIWIKAIIPAGLTLRSATLQYHFPVPYFYASASYDLVISSPSIDTDSATFKKYAKATAFLAGVSTYAVNMFKSAQGTVSINGVNRTISGVMKTATGMTVFHNAGSVALIAAATDPGASGFYNISGSYEIIATVEGAATMNLNAKVVDTYSIGTTVRYLNMAAKTMIAQTFDNSSARDKKKDIAPFSGSALDILNQVQVVNFRYKTDNDKHLHTGFIAEDTPDTLTGADHNSMSLGDNIGMLIKAVQELYQLILGGSNA